MHLKKKSIFFRSEDGAVLIQVLLASVVLLFVLFTGFKTARNTIKVANSTATSAAFKDFALEVEQNLASSQTCLQRLGLSAAPLLTSVMNPVNGYPVIVTDPDGLALAVVEPVIAPPCGDLRRCPSPEFRIKDVRLQKLVPKGWASGALPSAGTQELRRYSGFLWIVAERRKDPFGLIESTFLGSSEMTALIPILFGVDSAGRIRNCTKRTVFQLDLGPTVLPAGVVRKSGAECIDRGGTPLVANGMDWYVCRLPISTLLACKPSGTVCNDPKTCNLPGWFCYQETDLATAGGETYVY